MAPESGVGAARASWVLASGSPQRRAILERLGLQFSVRVPEVVELDSGDPASVTLENAGRKARAVQIPGRGERIIGCDTVVALEGAIYGKPSDEAQARRSGLWKLLPDPTRTFDRRSHDSVREEPVDRKSVV